MTSVVIPFLMSMLQGRTIDLKTYTIGGDIYDRTDYVETPLHTFNSTYNILQDNVFPYSYIGLPADLVLRIKSNYLSSASGALGLDGLLRTSWKSTGVTVTVTSMFQTVYREQSEDAKLLSNWTRRIDKSQTHYAASLIYGGWSVIMYRFECSQPEDNAMVRKILTSTLGETGVMSKTTVELWREAFDKLKNNPELKGDVNIKIQRFSSVPLSEDVSTPDKLWDALTKFKNDIGELGQPLFMELRPLHKLDNRFPAVRESHLLDRELEQIDELFDDLRETKTSMRKWLSDSLVEFTEEEEEKISNLLEQINGCIQMFNKIAATASVFNPMDVSLLKLAMLTYSRGLTKETTSYKMLYLRLKEDLDPNCENNFGPGLRGLLKVESHEKLELGQMRGGLEQCKEECLDEPLCRAIGYAEQHPALEYDTATKRLKIVKKFKQCWIYFRSSRTTTLIPSQTETSTHIYDRNCY